MQLSCINILVHVIIVVMVVRTAICKVSLVDSDILQILFINRTSNVELVLVTDCAAAIVDDVVSSAVFFDTDGIDDASALLLAEMAVLATLSVLYVRVLIVVVLMLVLLVLPIVLP